MGLAASQARFLGITARKSNIEYEGQQVNQQRTALAEEVNALYSKLLAIDVPIAPDATKFYESNYSFSVTNTDEKDGDYVIKNYYQNHDGTYHLITNRTYSEQNAEGKKHAGTSISRETDKNGNVTYYFETTNGKESLVEASNSTSMIELINKTYSNELDKNDNLYCYKDDDGVTHYFSKAQMDASLEDSSKSFSSYTSVYKENEESVIFENATVIFDDNNRMSSVVINELSENSIQVDTVRNHDDEGYQAALRDYTMSKDEYDKAIADLNAQTESLQQEDKVLELRLNQIDTEQNELQTELDAIKAVLDKNIEKTFNTFS